MTLSAVLQGHEAEVTRVCGAPVPSYIVSPFIIIMKSSTIPLLLTPRYVIQCIQSSLCLCFLDAQARQRFNRPNISNINSGVFQRDFIINLYCKVYHYISLHYHLLQQGHSNSFFIRFNIRATITDMALFWRLSGMRSTVNGSLVQKMELSESGWVSTRVFTWNIFIALSNYFILPQH